MLKQHFQQNQKRVVQIIGELLLPALALVEENNEISDLIWDIYQHADYTLRYEHYT